METTRYLTLLIAILICSFQDSLGIDAPGDVTVANEGSTNSLRVTWIAPDNAPENATAHEVQWLPADGNGTSGSLGGAIENYIITGLTPGTLYNVTVIAQNDTDTMEGTGEGRTIPSPVTLSELAATNDSISAQWPKPDGVVDQYLVTCSSGTVDPHSPIVDNGSAMNNASCIDLPTAGETYTITVTSQSGTEISSDSSENITALPNVVQIVAGLSTNSSYQAGWDHPAGEIDSFQVFCYENDPTPEEIINVTSANMYEVTCESLPTAGTGYQFSVVSVSREKNASSQTVLYTNPNIVNLRAESITTRQINVTWDDPEGVEDSFLVDCGANGTTDFTVDSGEPFQATCDVPMAGADFNITVTSVSGDKSSSVTETYMAATPDSVVISNSTSNTTSITVTWDAIPSADGFRVNCSEGTPSPSSPLPGDATQVTCDGVTPGGNHSVTIVTLENNGESPETVYFVVAVPLSVDLVANDSTTSSVSATWQFPGGIVDEFIVECINGTESNATFVVGQDLDTSYLVRCDGVENPGDNYTMVVTSVSNGQENSASILLTALPLSVDLVANDSTTSSVSATWQFPGGIVDGFEVECSSGNGTTYTVQDTGFLASCVNLETPGDDYTMTVSSLSNGQRNSTSLVLTALPEAVILMEVEELVTTDSITASWSNVTGVFDYYEVTCSDGTASPAQVNPTDDLMASCTGLQTPGDNYTISVTTVSNGQSSVTDSMTITALPNAVTLLEGPSNNTAISATWINPDSIVDTFDIMCSNGTASPSSIAVAASPTDMIFTAYCTELPTPGLEYNITVVAISYTKRSASSTVGVHASPTVVVLVPGDSNTTAVSATWMQPKGTVEHYEITCSLGDASPSIIEDTNEPSYSASCVNLQTPGDTYTMTVTSFVDNGMTNTSSNIELTALPESVTLMEMEDLVTTNTITASWSNVTGVFDYYEVTCSNGTASSAQVNPTDNLMASCTGLQPPGDNYTISVTTVSNGESSVMDSITITALPNAVTLSEGPSNNTAISATWTIPDSVVDTFDIMCSNGTASPSSIAVDESPTDMIFTAYCTELPTPGSEYNMTVVAISYTKRSASSTVGVHASPASVELQPGDSSTTAVSATWMQPKGTVEHYEIACSLGNASPSIIEDTNEPSYSASCVNLQTPGDTYTMTVTSFVDNGMTNTSSNIELTALPLSPDLFANDSTTTSVSAMWPYPGGSVDVFRVECSNGTESNATLVVDQDLDQDIDTSYLARCDGVWNPGDNYTMVVTSVSNGKENSASILLTALPLSIQLVASNSTTSSVSATWQFPGGIVDEFIVECSSGSEMDYTNEEYRASCEELDVPGDNYTMTVTSLSNMQSNLASIVLTALPEAVTLIEATDGVSTSSISATWNMSNGIVDYYDVFCPNGTASPDRVGSEDVLTAFCVNLTTPGNDYEISVTAVSGGQRSMTDTLTITALPEAVDLIEGASNTTVISVTWMVPTSVVDNFTITCSAGTASPSSIPVVSSQARKQLTAYCIDLPTSGDLYNLTVVAISKNKLSAPSTASVYALPLGVDLEEGPSTTSSVNATWMRQNDTVESYSITCSHGDASPSIIDDTNQESYEASCENLPAPGAAYTMIVYSEVGSSNSTRASSFIQLVSEPESVETISIEDYNTTGVNVQWQLKTCPNCVYNYFMLTFEPDSQEPISVDYTSSMTQYSSPVSGLTQGRNYSFTVVSVSGVGVAGVTLKTSEEQSVEQRTVPASASGLDIVPNKRSLSLTWTKAVGDLDNYGISVTPKHGTAVFNGDLEDPSGEVNGLTPGMTYEVAVVTISGAEISESLNGTMRTLPDTPSQVQNPIAQVIDKDTIMLTFEAPAEPNGDITSYMISYVGMRENNADHEFSSLYGAEVLSRTFNDLYPGFSYTFTIIAVNDGGFESEPVSSDPVVTNEEVPEPVPDNYNYLENTIVSDQTTSAFTVVLPEDLFSQDNGQLLTFSVIITTDESDTSIGSTNLTYAQAQDRKSGAVTPAYITKAGISYPYPPSYGSRRRRQTTEEAMVVVGDGSCSGSPNEYCNVQLNDDTQYYYAFRAYNNKGSVTSGAFGPAKTNKKTNVGGIVGGVISGLSAVFVVVVAFVVVKKRRNDGNSPRPSIEGSDNPGFVGSDQPMRPLGRNTGSSMHRKSNSKPVLLNNFENHYKRMKADSDLRFTEEYDEIRLVGKDQPIVAAAEMVNRAKNRFTNILPYEHSRVKLAAVADEPDTDYINANYMPGYNSPREFIACQGPLPGTLDDMWRMIWEKNTSTIVMLTQLVEKGKIKCHQYWPENYDPVTYGSIEVSLQAEQQYEHWVIREFTIVKGDDIRKITQFHFMKWPDHGVPSQTWTMLDFVRTVRETIQRQASDHPVLAHCSAGVGRTGTYIALDRLMQFMQENDFIDIYGIICEMRMQRNHMVQTEKQYIFIHDCVMDLMQREDEAGESIYVNMRSNGYNHEDMNDNLLDQAV